MVQEDDVVGGAAALGHRLPSIQAGVHLNPIATQNALGDYKIHLLVVNRQRPDANTGKGLPPCGLVLGEAPFSHLSVEQICHREGGKGLVDDKQTASAVQDKLSVRNHNNPDRLGQLLIIGPVLLIFRLGDKHMGQGMAALQLEEALKIVGLIPLNIKSLHQVQDQPVIIAPHLVVNIFFRPEIAGDTQLVRVVEGDTRLVVRHPLGNHDIRVQALPPLAVKVDKAPHGVEQSPGDGEPQAQPPREALASGVRLVEVVIHLLKLGIRHADSGVVDANNQIDPVIFPPVVYADVDAPLFGKFNGIFRQNLEHMGNFLRVPHKHRRYLGVDIKHQLQMLPVALQRGHGDDIVEHRGYHVLLFGRSQGAVHDLRVIHHVIDLVGQALSRHLNGEHILPNLRGELPAKGHLADANDHINGRAELVRHIGQKNGVLLSHRLQLCEYAVVPLPLNTPPLNPVPRKGRPAKGDNGTKHYADGRPDIHTIKNGAKNQRVIQQLQHIQRLDHAQNPFFVQHEQHKDEDTGHSGYVEKDTFMHAKEEKFHQQQSGAQILIVCIRTNSCNM